MNIVVIGSVAAGTSAAAKARRSSEEAEITVLEKGKEISYTSCGMPYLVSGLVQERKQLTPRDAAFFKERYRVNVRLYSQAEAIKRKEKAVQVRDLNTDEVYTMPYDRLIICTGALPAVPPLPGIDLPNVVALHSLEDLDTLIHSVKAARPKKACVVGSGFIGLEITESLVARGLAVTLIERDSSVMPYLDEDMAAWVRPALECNGVKVVSGDAMVSLEGDSDGVRRVHTQNGLALDAELVVLAMGVKPNVELARAAGLEIGITGAIKVNRYLQTNDPDILAAGDCMETVSRITGQPKYHPLGSTANKTGRLAGYNCLGGRIAFDGVLGTSICKLFETTVGLTGLTEKEALRCGFNVASAHLVKPNHPEYYPGSSEMVLKVVADKQSGRVLGAQVVGKEGADKRLDVLAAAIYFNARVTDLFQLDLAYAPPYSTTKDAIIYAGMALENALFYERPFIQAKELQRLLDNGQVTLIDVREPSQFEKGYIPGAVNIPLTDLRAKAPDLSQEWSVVVYCNSGTSGNAAQNILINLGFHPVFNLSGGYKNWGVVNAGQ